MIPLQLYTFLLFKGLGDLFWCPGVVPFGGFTVPACDHEGSLLDKGLPLLSHLNSISTSSRLTPALSHLVYSLFIPCPHLSSLRIYTFPSPVLFSCLPSPYFVILFCLNKSSENAVPQKCLFIPAQTRPPRAISHWSCQLMFRICSCVGNEIYLVQGDYNIVIQFYIWT